MTKDYRYSPKPPLPLTKQWGQMMLSQGWMILVAAVVNVLASLVSNRPVQVEGLLLTLLLVTALISAESVLMHIHLDRKFLRTMAALYGTPVWLIRDKWTHELHPENSQPEEFVAHTNALAWTRFMDWCWLGDRELTVQNWNLFNAKVNTVLMSLHDE